MTQYVLTFYYKLKNLFGIHSRNLNPGKRPRDCFEDDDENEYLEATTQLKRARWNTEPVSHVNMATSSRSESHTSSGIKRSTESLQHRTPLNQEIKENVYDLTSDDDDIEEITPIRTTGERPPLSPLPARHRVHNKPSKKEKPPSSTPMEQNGAIRKYKNNGRISAHLRVSRNDSSTSSITPTYSRNSALNESIRLDEKKRYSIMLKSFAPKGLIPTIPSVKTREFPKTFTRETHATPLMFRYQNKSSPSVHLVDLTKGDDSHIPVLQAQDLKLTSDEVKSSRKRVERVNSFEKKLKSYQFVAPQWIADIQQKYGAREREKRREVEEASLIKDLYEKHNIKFAEALSERVRKHLAITEVILDDTIEDVPTLPKLTPEMEQRVSRAYIQSPPSEVVAEGFGQRITRRDIYTLSKLNWLNDEVINFYMNLLIERGKNDNLPSVYAFNTFFYPKLASVGHSALKRWTKKVDIFAQDMVIVPVHLGMHWCLAIIDFRDKTIRYYDSMNGNNNRCLNALLKYLEDESLDKKKQPYDTTGWKLENVKDIPQQMNGSDCGMFACMFAEFISRNAKITFSQEDMPYFRRKMTYEILTAKLLT